MISLPIMKENNSSTLETTQTTSKSDKPPDYLSLLSSKTDFQPVLAFTGSTEHLSVLEPSLTHFQLLQEIESPNKNWEDLLLKDSLTREYLQNNVLYSGPAYFRDSFGDVFSFEERNLFWDNKNFNLFERAFRIFDITSDFQFTFAPLINESFEQAALFGCDWVLPSDMNSNFKKGLKACMNDSLKPNETCQMIAELSKILVEFLLCTSDSTKKTLVLENDKINVIETNKPSIQTLQIKQESSLEKDQENGFLRPKRSSSQGEHRRSSKSYQLAKYINFDIDRAANIPLQLKSSLDLGVNIWRCKRRQMFKNSKIRKAYSIAAMEDIHQNEEEKDNKTSSAFYEEEKTCDLKKEDATSYNENRQDYSERRRNEEEVTSSSVPYETQRENQEEGKTSSEADKVRYRLVKKRLEKRRSPHDNYSYHTDLLGDLEICSKGSPKPGFCEENPACPDLQDTPDNQQKAREDYRNEIKENIETAKENDEEKEIEREDEEGEGETREGSQKDLLDYLLQFDDNDFPAKTNLVEDQKFDRGKGIISEKWSNSDSREFELEGEDLENLALFVCAIENNQSPSEARYTKLSQPSSEESEKIIETRHKNRRRRERESHKNKREYENEKNRKENESKSVFKCRSGGKIIIYEAKSKVDALKSEIAHNVLTEKSNKTELATQILQTPPKNTQNTSQNSSTETKPKVRKPLSLKSPCLDTDVIKTAKIKLFAKEFFDKKFEKDIFDHVANLTEESNKIMPFRILAHSRIDYVIKKVFTGLKVQTKIFGSCATGLALPTSDVDICVCDLPAFGQSEVAHYLVTIHDKLKKFKWVVSNKKILTASVPVIKLEIDPTIAFSECYAGLDENSILQNMIQEAPNDLNSIEKIVGSNTRIKIDLSVESLDPLGGFTSHLGYKSTEFVQQKLDEHEFLYTVAIILKEFLNNRGLLDNYQGGLSSYCLVVMIVAIFKKFTDENEMKSLMRVLSFYGEGFEPDNTGITIVGKEPFFPLNCCFEQAPLWILDNVNFMRRNIGQGAFAIKKILHEFEKATKLTKVLHEEIEKIALKYIDKINCCEDIEKIEDAEFCQLLNFNIADYLVNYQ